MERLIDATNHSSDQIVRCIVEALSREKGRSPNTRANLVSLVYQVIAKWPHNKYLANNVAFVRRVLSDAAKDKRKDIKQPGQAALRALNGMG